MSKYITASGLELLVSGSTSNWVANSTAKETQLGSSKNDVFHGSGGDTRKKCKNSINYFISGISRLQ
jgi:hypothetical protein